MTKIKHIDFCWSEAIQECVCNEVQTILDNADGTPPIVENPDGLDFQIGGDANEIGPGVSNDDNPEELLDTIDMNHLSVLNVEPAGFQALEHRFNGPSFLVGRKGFLGFAEGPEDLRFRPPIRILYHGTGQVAEFATYTVDAMQYSLFSMSKIGEDVLGKYLPTVSRVLHAEVVADADMILDGVVVEPFEPFVADELPASHQAFDAIPTEQADETLHDVYPLFVIGVPAFRQQPEQYGKKHMIIRYTQN